MFRFVETFHHFFAFCLSVFWILLVKHHPAGKYLCAYFKDYTADRDLFIKMFLEYVKFNNIKLKGIMIQQFKIDVTVTDDPKETIIEFQALV